MELFLLIIARVILLIMGGAVLLGGGVAYTFFCSSAAAVGGIPVCQTLNILQGILAAQLLLVGNIFSKKTIVVVFFLLLLFMATLEWVRNGLIVESIVHIICYYALAILGVGIGVFLGNRYKVVLAIIVSLSGWIFYLTEDVYLIVKSFLVWGVILLFCISYHYLCNRSNAE